MKKGWIFVLILCLLALCPALGEESAQKKITFQGSYSAPADAERIDLGNVKANSLSDLIAFLRQFPNLKKVDMFSTPVSAAGIAQLEKALPQVEFGWTIRIPCNNPLHPERTYHYIRTDATAFSTLHNNQCLPHSSQDFAVLKYCKNMLALDLGHNRLDRLDFLYDMPQLRVLILAVNEIEDITPISSLHDLEYLEIFKNHITDLSPLENLTRLMDLNICFNNVRDYRPLTGLTGLQRLWLYNSNNYSDSSPVPGDAVQMLRSALPGTRINSTSYSTLGGWRTANDKDDGVRAPHYAVIYDMFNTGAYIPFAESAPLE